MKLNHSVQGGNLKDRKKKREMIIISLDERDTRLFQFLSKKQVEETTFSFPSPVDRPTDRPTCLTTGVDFTTAAKESHDAEGIAG